jgi:hypothetical protein
MTASVKGFGRRAIAHAAAITGGRRRKASRERTREIWMAALPLALWGFLVGAR